MFLIDEILKYRSLSVVGLEKNTGKTECLNYLLRGLRGRGRNVAVTSIGVDGETCDQIYGTSKPEIRIFEGMYFVTTGNYFLEKQLTAEIIRVDDQQTALGKLVTAKALNGGAVVLSGPVHTVKMKTLIEGLLSEGMDIVIIDGALSRLSLGAPAITESMILATGAALSGNVAELVRRTKYTCDLIGLPEVEPVEKARLEAVEQGVWVIGEDGGVIDLNKASALSADGIDKEFFRYGSRFYAAGAVGDKFLSSLKCLKYPVELIVRDFTRIFACPEVFYAYLKSGKKISVLQKSRLLAICVNPQSPEGIVMDSDVLCERLGQEVDVPVFDVRKMGDNYAV